MQFLFVLYWNLITGSLTTFFVSSWDSIMRFSVKQRCIYVKRSAWSNAIEALVNQAYSYISLGLLQWLHQIKIRNVSNKAFPYLKDDCFVSQHPNVNDLEQFANTTLHLHTERNAKHGLKGGKEMAFTWDKITHHPICYDLEQWHGSLLKCKQW